MIRSISSDSSGDGDEFFDAVEHLDLEDNSNGSTNGNAENKEICRLPSVDESNLEEESNSSDKPREQLEETEEIWESARSFSMGASDRSLNVNKSTSYSASVVSLLDSVPTESVSEEENLEDKQNNDTDKNGNSSAREGKQRPASPARPIVPPIDMSSLPSSQGEDHDIYSVPTKEMEQIVRKEYDERDVQTLNKLVDKLKAVELSSRTPEEEKKLSPEDEIEDDNQAFNTDDEAIVVVQNESIQDDDNSVRYFTPQKIDCGLVSDVICDGVKSPLETLYLFCPRELSHNSKGGGSQRWSRYDAAAASPPPRTSLISLEDEMSMGKKDVVTTEQSSRLPSSDHEQIDNHARRLDLDSDSTSDESSASGGKYQMVNKDTGVTHDVRDVMKQIDEVGSSDALDTHYSFLPTKDQLEFERMSSLRGESNEVDDNEIPAVPLASASFDSAIVVAVPAADLAAEETTPKKPERKRVSVNSSIKFSKAASSMIAAKALKGVAGLKSSHQQKKLNRKRTTSADMLPCNAIHVRSSSRQKQGRFKSSVSSVDESLADSSFNPMLLIKTIPDAHKGPAWCAAFSLNGRFLATGGEDGNVCIWAVSPKSKVMHPNGVANQHEENSCDECGSDDENTESPTTAKEEQKASTPPLQFIGAGPELATSLEILSSDPIHRFQDHTADVIDLSWSHTNFLLSASVDTTVRLYHHSKPGCLHLFKHADIVASVSFHPKDDRHFISGGIDKKLRLWDITDGRVKEWAQAPDVITAARFTPDGKYAVAGLFHGQVYFYDVVGLKYYTQIACRNRSGKHSRGKKVTGISFVRAERDDWLLKSKQETVPEQDENSANDDRNSTLTGQLSDTGKDLARRMSSAFRNQTTREEALRYTERMLVSTNDSRVRLYGLSDFCLVRKYKGHTNHSMQIRARVSESGSHIACGSESGHVYIWETMDKNRQKKNNVNMKVHQTNDKTKRTDHFEASKASLPIVTESAFFPTRSINEALLSSSQVFPFSLGMDRVDDDMSSAAILTLDYDGTMRVFFRKTCIDNILDAATPRGGTMT
mmetsp:Transcript_16090/g.34015  ORF Transcript_16090/g.34015 Transcript_16090/m.34015 type:complete len:1048 (-) Transcript_16090:54-3197(-)